MQAIRCSCGAVHSADAVQHIGRQYGADGEYMELANCPTCGSTISLGAQHETKHGTRHETKRRRSSQGRLKALP